jgi:hypothetical protein
MNCADYFDANWQMQCDRIIQEQYWDGGVNTDALFDSMKRDAAKDGVTLTDTDTWDYEDFFYQTYRDTEKGLS